MDAVKAKQKYMRWVRKFIKQVKSDPFLRRDANIDDLTVEMYKWDKNAGRGLFVVYDRSVGKQYWNTDYCQWEWIRFESTFARSTLWHAANRVVCEMRIKTSSK